MIEKYNPLKADMLQILNEEGVAKLDLEPKLSESELKKIYSLMAATRAADLKALKLQRQGRMGTFAPSLGHEASQVGSAFAIRKEDWVFPYFRDLGTYITLGFPLKNYYLYWMGNEEGMLIPSGLNIFTIAVPVASQLPQAVDEAENTPPPSVEDLFIHTYKEMTPALRDLIRTKALTSEASGFRPLIGKFLEARQVWMP